MFIYLRYDSFRKVCFLLFDLLSHATYDATYLVWNLSDIKMCSSISVYNEHVLCRRCKLEMWWRVAYSRKLSNDRIASCTPIFERCKVYRCCWWRHLHAVVTISVCQHLNGKVCIWLEVVIFISDVLLSLNLARNESFCICFTTVMYFKLCIRGTFFSKLFHFQLAIILNLVQY